MDMLHFSYKKIINITVEVFITLSYLVFQV